MAPTPTGRMEDVSSLPGRIQNLQKQVAQDASTEQKSSAIDATAAPLNNALQKTDSKEADVFKSRLDELRAQKDEALKEYQENNNKVVNAELIDALGKGIAQLAAGWYGLNTGRDAVSGVDFKPKDWSNNYLLAEREYRIKHGSIEEEIKDIRGQQRELAKEERAENLYQQRVGQAEKREEEARRKEGVRASEGERKIKEKLTRDLAEKLENLRVAKGKDRRKLEGEVAGTMRQLGLPSDTVKQAMDSYDSPMFGYDYSKLENIVEQLQKPEGPSATPSAPIGGPRMIDMVAPDGRKLRVPENAVQEMESKGAKRV